jgi:hypothetical protein
VTDAPRLTWPLHELRPWQRDRHEAAAAEGQDEQRHGTQEPDHEHLGRRTPYPPELLLLATAHRADADARLVVRSPGRPLGLHLLAGDRCCVDASASFT